MRHLRETGCSQKVFYKNQKSRGIYMDEKKNKEDESYEFIKETIKKKPLDRKKMWKAAGILAGAGAIFGLTAALVFAVVEPQISQAVENKKRTEQKVEIPTDEETEKKEEQQTDAGIDTEDISESDEGEQSVFSIDNYSEMYKEVLKKADKIKEAMVTVIGVKSDEDWFQTPYESQMSGVIVADNGQELYVLTQYGIVKNVDRIQVQFCDDTVVDARFLKSDINTGLTILKISDSEIESDTRSKIGTAVLGNSYSVEQGEPVIAVGSPMEYKDSIGFGILTSVTNSVSKIDAEYGILTTDIVGSEKGSGVLLNTEGELIGVIAQSFALGDSKNMVTGLAVSQIKELIETLSNNQSIVYMGVTGETITPQISEKKGIPKGVFVESVEVDSPAMQAGIQNADVITEVNGEKIESMKEYQQQLKACNSGDTIKVKAMRQATEGYVEVTFDVTLGAL